MDKTFKNKKKISRYYMKLVDKAINQLGQLFPEGQSFIMLNFLCYYRYRSGFVFLVGTFLITFDPTEGYLRMAA